MNTGDLTLLTFDLADRTLRDAVLQAADEMRLTVERRTDGSFSVFLGSAMDAYRLGALTQQRLWLTQQRMGRRRVR